MNITWPNGKSFAFTIFDNTDAMTLAIGRQVYGFLEECGFRTTKSCWTFHGDRQKGRAPGDTLDDDEYRQWLLELDSKGFEIGWHGASYSSSRRVQTASGLERFAEVFGHYPAVAANHFGQLESLHWGSNRLTSWRRLIYNVMTRYRKSGKFRGHVVGDEYFWGDLCRAKIKYFRNFAFRDINTLKACPFMPYYDPLLPYVNYWFASSDGHDVAAYNRCITEKQQDRLEAEGGACIMYTHFSRFCEGGSLDGRFTQLMERLAKKNGWFVPVTTLLDFLLMQGSHHNLNKQQRRWLEQKWLMEKLLLGTT